MAYLRRQGRHAAFVTFERHAWPERIVRKHARKLKSDIALYQGRLGLRRKLYIEVLEAEPKVHSHIVARMPDAASIGWLRERLHNSALYGTAVVTEAVSDWPGLTDYLLGEATSTAWYGAGMRFPRVPGSHPLGAGGGDRVRPSDALRAALEGTQRIKPYRRSYAKRSLPTPLPAEGEAQLVLFRRLEKPVSRLADFNGGLLPASVSLEITHHRKRLGLTQTKLANMAGISKQQFTNALKGRFGLAPWVVVRLREVLLSRGETLALEPLARAA